MAAAQLLVRRWDAELSRDVLAHWLDLMSASGWIPREQILGAEAAVRVPVEYVTQKVGSAGLLPPRHRHVQARASLLF